MDILWDKAKEKKLVAERGISFATVAELILERKYVDILENPARSGQFIFLVPIRGYVHVVPFMIDSAENIVLKTVFPSRKFNLLYGEQSHEKDT